MFKLLATSKYEHYSVGTWAFGKMCEIIHSVVSVKWKQSTDQFCVFWSEDPGLVLKGRESSLDVCQPNLVLSQVFLGRRRSLPSFGQLRFGLNCVPVHKNTTKSYKSPLETHVTQQVTGRNKRDKYPPHCFSHTVLHCFILACLWESKLKKIELVVRPGSLINLFG